MAPTSPIPEVTFTNLLSKGVEKDKAEKIAHALRQHEERGEAKGVEKYGAHNPIPAMDGVRDASS